MSTPTAAGTTIFTAKVQDSSQPPEDVSLELSITIDAAGTPLTVDSFSLNSGASSTTSRTVTLNNSCSGSPTHHMASESSSFTGASWQIYSTSPSFALSSGDGTKQVYFKVKNAAVESSSTSDTITLNEDVPPPTPGTMVSVPAGTFQMGDPWDEGGVEEVISEEPVHSVTLSAYEIGKYEVTSQQYAGVLNWALAQGYLDMTSPGQVRAYGNDLFNFDSDECQIAYAGGVFVVESRDGQSMEKR